MKEPESVDCPTCGAPAGVTCRDEGFFDPRGVDRDVLDHGAHRDRRRAASGEHVPSSYRADDRGIPRR